MKAIKKYHFLSLALLLFLVAPACKKDKDDNLPPTPGSGSNNPSPTGSMSADANGTAFESEYTSAELNFSNKLTIFAHSETAIIQFSISSFAGAVSYSLSPQWNNSANYNTQNVFSTDNGGSGNLTITSYNETDLTISGHFQFVAVMSGAGGNSINITDGSFEDIPLTNVTGPEEGHALYTINGNLATPDTARAYITDHYRFVVDVDRDSYRYKFHAYANPNSSPLNITSGKLLQQSISTGSFFNVLGDPTVEITEYNEEELYVAGRIYQQSSNLDIRFNRIPFSLPTLVEPGQAVLNTPEGAITFEDAVYIPFYEIYTMEATNSSNQKIIVQTEYSFGEYEPSHFYGYSGTLKFYENADGPVTYTQYGYWKSYSGNPGSHIGFVSYNDEFSAKGFHVPY